MVTTIQVHEEFLKARKKFRKSYFGAFPGRKEFNRHEEEDDRLG